LLRPDSTDFVRRQKSQQIPGALPPERFDDGVVVCEEEPFQGSPIEEKAGHEKADGAKKGVANHEAKRGSGHRVESKASPMPAKGVKTVETRVLEWCIMPQ
jgi:hypothetical protein